MERDVVGEAWDDMLPHVIEDIEQGAFEMSEHTDFYVGLFTKMHQVEKTQARDLVEPISINFVERGFAFIQAMETYHDDTFAENAFACNNCEICQAIQAAKIAINGVYTVVGLPAMYEIEQ